MKKNFQCDEKVRIVNTTSSDLDGQICVILGKSQIHITDTYIILLEAPYTIENDIYNESKPYTCKAISLTESCLERI